MSSEAKDYAKIEAGECQVMCQVMCAPKFIKDPEKDEEFSFKIANDISEASLFDRGRIISEACLFDRGRIQQITANLIGGIASLLLSTNFIRLVAILKCKSNAIKFVSHDGMGKVDVSVENLVDG